MQKRWRGRGKLSKFERVEVGEFTACIACAELRKKNAKLEFTLSLFREVLELTSSTLAGNTTLSPAAERALASLEKKVGL